jgi:hypothetical protein
MSSWLALTRKSDRSWAWRSAKAGGRGDQGPGREEGVGGGEVGGGVSVRLENLKEFVGLEVENILLVFYEGGSLEDEVLELGYAAGVAGLDEVDVGGVGLSLQKELFKKAHAFTSCARRASTLRIAASATASLRAAAAMASK